MTENQILDYLNSLQEHKMAKDIFVPVMKKMGLKGVKFTGGASEQGIDIEYYELTEPEKHKSYVGVQFKKGNLSYSAHGTKNSIKEIKNQAEEAFEKGIPDENSATTHYIGRFIVATTGIINNPARDFINKAKAKGQDRRINFWDGEKLAEYINEYWINEFVNYFNICEDNEEDEVELPNVINEEYILDNYSELIRDCKKVKATISGLEWDILLAVVDKGIFEDNSVVSLSDILFELGKSEDQINYELINLVRKLEYLSIDDNQVHLCGYASKLEILAGKIIEELVDADENDDLIAEKIFNKVIL